MTETLKGRGSREIPKEDEQRKDTKEYPKQSVINNKYEVIELIAKGGMGTIYKVRHLKLNTFFALKVLNIVAKEDMDTILRFKREAETVSGLGHENIVKVIDFDETQDGNFYIVMEYLEGEELRTILKKRGKLPWEEWKPILEQIVNGLDAAHKKGIVHRDLKPENIFITKDPQGNLKVKILDFGVSKIKESEIVLTKPGEILGTPYYMSPEQAKGDLKIDHRSDIFSLGVLSFEVLSGKVPFGGLTPFDVINQILFEAPPEIYKLNPEIPRKVQKVFEVCLNKDPDKRYQSVKEFLNDLKQAFEGEKKPKECVASQEYILINRLKFWLYITLAFLVGIIITLVIWNLLISK